ncbi:unnamed protein product [Caenorhabditis brenneri]
MEWKNDILSFSGFEYGVSRQQKQSEELKYEQNTISEPKDSLLEDNVELKGSANQKHQEEAKETERIIFDNEKCEFDAMAERKIENTYFRNIEQVEKKMKKLTALKSKWSEPWQTGDEILTKTYLRPRSYDNPWKDGTMEEKNTFGTQKQSKTNGKCMIS